VTADVVRIASDDVLMIYDQYVGGDLPTDADLDALVRSIETRLEPALTIVTPPDGALPVVFTPGGLAAIVLRSSRPSPARPFCRAARRSPPEWGSRCSTRASRSATIRWRRTARHRVPSMTNVWLRRDATGGGGVVRAFVYDLETATRAKVRTTGNGRRGIFANRGFGTRTLLSANPVV